MATNEQSKNVCEICKSSEANEYDYGEWKTFDDCTIHYFCALLSDGCLQNGDDNEGILGFLVPDIRYMIKAHTKCVCSYCKKKGATLRCMSANCHRRFHLVCGVKNKCLNIFDDTFPSYCHRHVNIKEKYDLHGDFWNCQICNEAMGDYDPITSIPSCCGYGYYHKKCMQKYAISAGYLAKCPSCGNDPDGYRAFLRSRGIFCPDKDADWELSEDAFASLLKVVKTCDADECLCPKGRDFSKHRGKWQIFRCRFCGGVGVHAKCRTDDSEESFGCRACVERSSILVSVQTQPSVIDDPESSNNNSKTSHKRKHPFDAEGEGKIWKMVPTDQLSFFTYLFT